MLGMLITQIKKLIEQDKRNQTHGEYMIYTAMYGNGQKTGTQATIATHQ